MFQRNKISHRVTATCSNENHTATYDFIEPYDECWVEMAEDMFHREFGEYPTRVTRDSYEKIN